MNIPWQVAVASSDIEGRRGLSSILVRQGLDPILISSLSECRELMEKERIGLIFCDRHLSDGDYRELLDVSRSASFKVRVVLTSKHADWDEYLEAMRLGAFDVIASPCRPTDVEWMVIQAKRDERTHSREPIMAPKDFPARHAAIGKIA
jgi:DNA-binding NtrC family response regulator